jgi:AcrR family transcriptional regulator
MDPAVAPVVAATSGARLPPDDRRRHLLNVSRAIVEENGVGALSMESVAARAGVSRGLVYKYFGNRTDLVDVLWSEVAALWSVEAMPPHEELVGAGSLRELFDNRLVSNTRWFFDQVERSGLLFHRLQSEPAIAEVRKRVEQDNIVWWARLVQAMGVDKERALVFSTLVNAPSHLMWSLIARDQAPRETIETVFFLTCQSSLDRLLASEGANVVE